MQVARGRVSDLRRKSESKGEIRIVVLLSDSNGCSHLAELELVFLARSLRLFPIKTFLDAATSVFLEHSLDLCKFMLTEVA